MKKVLKRLAVLSVGLIVLFATSVAWGRSGETSINSDLCSELKEYCKRNGLDTCHCIVVDFSIYSGKERLFIVDINNNRIDVSGLCAHGIGKSFDCAFKPKFSNEIGSNLSSLGHYKLGVSRNTSKYNLNAIELHGLDPTNSNAYARGILIHDGLPDVKIIGLPCLPLSQGCFTVTSNAFNKITKRMSESGKPLMIYSTNESIF